MPKATAPPTLTAGGKPVWPYPHITTMTADVARNQWVKKIRGRVHSFGILTDRAGRWSFEDCALAALNRYQQDGPALHAGLVLDTPKARDGVTVGEVCGLFLQNKLADVEKGTLHPRTYRDYEDTARAVGVFFGPKRPVGALKPLDFEKLLRAQDLGPTRRRNFVIWTRMIFNWAHDPGNILEVPVRFGKGFKGGTAKERRQLKHRAGANFLPAAELRLLLAALPRTGPGCELRAMILLGINTGLGNTDVASLREEHLKLLGDGTALLDFPRPKTGIQRKAVLWPETNDAIREAMAYRRPPRRPEDAGLVFLTEYGNPWVDYPTDNVTKNFRRLLEAVGLIPRKKPRNPRKAPGKKGKKGEAKRSMAVGFYTLRRTYRTVADEAGDQHAVHLNMGHSLPGMSDVYVQRIGPARLRKVSMHVRHWLLSGDLPPTDLLAPQRSRCWLFSAPAAPVARLQGQSG